VDMLASERIADAPEQSWGIARAAGTEAPLD
jgi:hypothetical protein